MNVDENEDNDTHIKKYHNEYKKIEDLYVPPIEDEAHDIDYDDYDEEEE